MNVQRTRTMAAAIGLVVSAIALAGCDNHGKGKAVIGSVTAPSVDALSSVVATIVPAGFVPGVIGVPCAVFVMPNVALRISSAATVDMNSVTLTLGDGGSVGGPSVTFPTPALTQQFGSTVIVAGTPRLFVFSQPFGCAPVPNPLLFANLVVSDQFGNIRSIGVSTALR